MIANIKKFVQEVSVEMKKVSWPTREQLKESTMVVVVVTSLITLLVLIMDGAVSWGVDKLFIK